jgi:hypothetical protein
MMGFEYTGFSLAIGVVAEVGDRVGVQASTSFNRFGSGIRNRFAPEVRNADRLNLSFTSAAVKIGPRLMVSSKSEIAMLVGYHSFMSINSTLFTRRFGSDFFPFDNSTIASSGISLSAEWAIRLSQKFQVGVSYERIMNNLLTEEHPYFRALVPYSLALSLRYNLKGRSFLLEPGERKRRRSKTGRREK